MKIRRNILLFKLNYFFGDLWPLSALAIVYFEQITGSYASALGVFSVAKIVQTFSELPTGILSDRIGRKNTMVASALMFLICFIAFALAGNIHSSMLLMLGGVLWGLADAFASGTDDALMYETMQELRKEAKYDILYAGSKMFSQIGLSLGALIATVVTYFYSLNTLAWISVLPILGQVIVTMLLVEPSAKYKEEKESSSFSHFLKALHSLLKNKKLQLIALIQVFSKSTGYAAYRLEGVYFNNLIPTWMVNITRVIKQASGVISYAIAPKVRHFGFFKILLVSSIGNALVRGLSLILNNYATPFLMSLVNLFYGTEATAESALLQKELSSQQRATMGSVIALVGGFMAALIYYIFGMIADIFGIYTAILLLILCKVISGLCYYLLLKKYK